MENISQRMGGCSLKLGKVWGSGSGGMDVKRKLQVRPRFDCVNSFESVDTGTSGYREILKPDLLNL